MAKIKRVEDLPSWYDLEKYKACKDFKAIDWVSNLRSRILILECFHTEREGEAIEFAKSLREDPIDHSGTLPSTPITPLSFVHLTSRGGLKVALANANPAAAEPWLKMLKDIAAGSWLPRSADKEPIWNDIDSYPLLVNLNATDSVLIEAFRTWLRDTRKQQPSAKKREKPAYKTWEKYGLLPYTDLLIWSKETGETIPYRVMADAVGYKKGGESFRKTVPPLAQSLMEGLDYLEALAAIEKE